jgi:hypothetical protein
MVTRLLVWKNKAVASFWRLADKRIPRELLLLVLGGVALLAYVVVLFFGTRPRK